MRLPFLRGAGVAAGAAGAVGAGAVGYLLRRSLPPLDGEVQVRGLGDTVHVIRDRWGIPHISARSLADALFGQGYCHAQDRLWQMDVSRRLARGQLAEALGPDLLDIDRFMRCVGLHRAAQAEWEGADAEVRAALYAYAAGVNAYLARLVATGKVPIELVLTGVQPRPWEPLDSLSFGRYMAFTQSPNWESEIMRARLIAKLGYVAASALEPDVWRPDSTTLPQVDDWGPAAAPGGADLPPGVAPGGPPGSNAWVVSGERSSTGRPLLANDPHLFPRVPSVFYEAHLTGGGELNVAGASIPGLPGIVVGHNRRIAWGITASVADVQDLFVERLDPGDRRRTEAGAGWDTGVVVRELIHVKGRKQPWVEDVLVTRHGPLITPTPLLPDEHRCLALKSVVLEATRTAGPLLALNRASSWEEFRAALAGWQTPSLNVVYADVDGNVGYQMVGHIPVRARGDGLVPAPGWTGHYDWTGVVPFNELPRAFNPDDGLWANANQDPAKGSPRFLSHEFVDPARYRRIRQVLEGKRKHSAVDFSALQADEVSLPGREVARLLALHLGPIGRREARVLEMLAHWDGRMSADSGAAAVYAVFRNELVRASHAEALGESLPALLGVGPHPVVGPVWSAYFLQTSRVLARVSAWAESASADHGAHVEDDVQRAFRSSVRFLRRRLGRDPTGWQWGRLHPLAFQHPLSSRKPLGLLFDVPSFPWGGDLETVRAGGHAAGALHGGGPVSAYRFIADCSDWDATLSCIPGGQSGQRGSPHYADQVDAWRKVAYHPLAFSKPAVSRVARHTLVLARLL